MGGGPRQDSPCNSVFLQFLTGPETMLDRSGLTLTNASGLSQIGRQEAELRAFLGRCCPDLICSSAAAELQGYRSNLPRIVSEWPQDPSRMTPESTQNRRSIDADATQNLREPLEIPPGGSPRGSSQGSPQAWKPATLRFF